LPTCGTRRDTEGGALPGAKKHLGCFTLIH
jgi:hypothetical protein